MGHGHVIPNPDGSLARCGGPATCVECREEYFRNKPLCHCPKCGSPLLDNGRVIWCSFVGDQRPGGQKACDYEIAIPTRSGGPI